MIKIVILFLYFYSLSAFSCDSSKIRYVEFPKLESSPKYTNIPELNVKLPVNIVDKHNHDSGDYLFTTIDDGVVAINHLNLKQAVVDELFSLAQDKSEDDCKFASISKSHSINFASFLIEVEYSYYGYFIAAKGKSPSGKPLSIIYMKKNFGRLVVISNIPGNVQNKFIEGFIFLNKK